MSITKLIDVSISNEGAEVIDTDYVKRYCRIAGTGQDTLLTTLIKSARQDVERYADISIVTKTIRSEWAEAYEYVILPKPKIGAITSVVAGGNTLTLNNDYTVKGQDKKYIYGNFPDGLVVIYEAGYGTNTPEALKMCIAKKVIMDYEARTGLSIVNEQTILLPNSWEKTAISYRPTWMMF